MCRIIAVLTATCLLLTTINADTNYRLNSLVKPSQYDITITPHFDTNNDLAFTFDGQVYIKVVTAETNINKIRLHSEDLVFDASSILITSETSVIGLNPDNPIQVIQQYSFVDINLETTLEPNVIYTIDISYSGPIRDDLNGFYRSYYYEKGVKKWLGATQMEPTHARKVFPCFDEPEYKAVFVLTIDSPENYSPSMANMKLKSSTLQPNGYNRNVFYPTPIMSTYLVAFLVSEFTDHRSTEGTKIIGVYTRPEAYNQSEYAFEMAKKVEQALSTYFNIDYFSKDDYLKLDHIALPDFRAGAMENWGLVKYREGSLLYVPEESSPNYKYGVAQIIAHETTHMWFGDLVTCHWWSDTWLNEGFANYFQDYIVAQIDPTIGSGDILVTGSVYSAYSADETPSAVPISNENVNSPSEISNHFGTISYQKAGSVIRMMHHLLGNTAFANGLNSYLVTNEFSVGYPNLMYSALQQAANSAGSLANYPGATVSGVMGSWVSQAGHPVVVVSVDSDTGNITLRQSRFYTNSSIKTNELYPIPITYTTKSASNFANTKPAFIMTDGVHVFNEPAVKDHGWIMFNIQETGFYRVNYDAHIWSHIGEALNSDDRTNIHYLNRAKVVNDLFAFLTADEVSFGTLYDVLAFLKKETHFSVWYAAISGMNSLRTRYIGTEDLADIDKYILDIMDNIINTLGYVEKSQDDYLTIRNRMQVLEFACKLGHQGCIDAAVTKFQSLKTSGTRISPSLRRVSYCNGLRYGNAADFDFLWSKMLSTNVANEALIIQGTLGCTKVESKLKEYMASITKTDSPIRSQDVNNPLSSILSDHDNAALVLSYLKSNYTLLSNVYPSMSTVVNAVASALHTDAQFNEFDSWLSGCTLCSADVVQSGRTSLTSAKGATVWAKDHRSDIMKLLKNASAKLTPSLLVILSCFLMFY